MNLTLSVDERVAAEARRQAQLQGKSLNQVVREYLEQLSAVDDAERDIQEMRELTLASQGDSRGWKFDRDEIHERS